MSFQIAFMSHFQQFPNYSVSELYYTYELQASMDMPILSKRIETNFSFDLTNPNPKPNEYIKYIIIKKEPTIIIKCANAWVLELSFLPPLVSLIWIYLKLNFSNLCHVWFTVTLSLYKLQDLAHFVCNKLLYSNMAKWSHPTQVFLHLPTRRGDFKFFCTSIVALEDIKLIILELYNESRFRFETHHHHQNSVRSNNWKVRLNKKSTKIWWTMI